MSATVDIDAQRPAEASTLPVSDKPVTLSFKGGFGQKLGLTGNSAAGPVKKPIPAPVGFSMADDDGSDNEDSEDKGPAGDLKGLSHLRCERAVLWRFELTFRPIQLLR